MNLLSFFRPNPDTSELRDRLIEAETRVAVLEDLVNRPQRRGREIRCDARSYKDAKSEMTKRLHRELSATNNMSLAEAVEQVRARQ